MSSRFYSHTKQKRARSLQADSISIGCEAWIDVRRFWIGEDIAQQTVGNPRTFRAHSQSAGSHGSLAKSLTLLRKKLRRSFIKN